MDKILINATTIPRRNKLSKGLVAIAVLAFSGAGLSLATLIQAIIRTTSSGNELYLGWFVILGVLFATLYLFLEYKL